jgi:hypothetical protein
MTLCNINNNNNNNIMVVARARVRVRARLSACLLLVYVCIVCTNIWITSISHGDVTAVIILLAARLNVNNIIRQQLHHDDINYCIVILFHSTVAPESTIVFSTAVNVVYYYSILTHDVKQFNNDILQTLRRDTTQLKIYSRFEIFIEYG